MKLQTTSISIKSNSTNNIGKYIKQNMATAILVPLVGIGTITAKKSTNGSRLVQGVHINLNLANVPNLAHLFFANSKRTSWLYGKANS